MANRGPAATVVAAVTVSSFGTWAYNVGVGVYAYDRTHSAAWVAGITVGRYLPAVLLSWGVARLVDRLPRRALAIGTDLFCVLIMLALAGLAADDASLWTIAVVAALSSTSARVQAAALMSLAADVVPESRLARTSLHMAAAEAVATAVGSAAASALLVSVDPSGLFVLNGVTFAVSAVLVGRLRSVAVRPHRTGTTRAPAVPGLRALQAARMIGAYVYGADIVLLAVVAARDGHTGGYGLLLAAAGVGGVLALVPTRHRAGGASTAPLASLGMALYALPMLVLVPAGSFDAGLAAQLARGAGAVLATSSVLGTLQRVVPSPSAGRIFGVTQSLVLIGTCAGSLGTAGLLALTGPGTAIVITVVAAVAAQALVHPMLARLDRRDARDLSALDPRLAALRSLDLLRDANRATLYEVADSVEEGSAVVGEVIVAHGEEADAFYVLVSGRVEVTDEAGRPLRTMTAPDHFGELGLLHRTPRTATVTALEPCELWRVPGERFLAAVAEAGVSGALAETIVVRFDTAPAVRAPAPR